MLIKILLDLLEVGYDTFEQSRLLICVEHYCRVIGDTLFIRIGIIL